MEVYRRFVIKSDKYCTSIAVIGVSIITLSIFFTKQEHLHAGLFLLYGLPVMHISVVNSLRHGVALSALALIFGIVDAWSYSRADFASGGLSGISTEAILGLALYLSVCLLVASHIKRETVSTIKYKALANELAYAAQELKSANNNITHLYVSTIQALAAAIDAKDPYTSGHSERVTKFALAISQELALPEEEVQQIVYASILHDIGKIGISESILSKPGRLEPEEFEKIQKHPTIGANIISSISMLDSVIPIIVHHHEQYNGGGYPFNKAEANIPLGARIIAVADAFDAMTSNRPYRKALSIDKAVEEIKRCAGTQFDPQIVNAFLRTL